MSGPSCWSNRGTKLLLQLLFPGHTSPNGRSVPTSNIQDKRAGNRFGRAKPWGFLIGTPPVASCTSRIAWSLCHGFSLDSASIQHADCNWQLALTCVGEIDLRVLTTWRRSLPGGCHSTCGTGQRNRPSPRGNVAEVVNTDARPAICGWRRRWGRLRAQQASSGSGDGSEKWVVELDRYSLLSSPSSPARHQSIPVHRLSEMGVSKS